MTLHPDRQRGCLLGLAVGDALGAAVEFKKRGSFPPVTGYRAGGPFGLAPGEWTDDTSMALALADSVATTGWDLHDQLRRYVHWMQCGTYSVNDRCFDIGNATRAALDRFLAHFDARSAGDPSEYASGNGSIMRLAPVPIRYGHLLDTDFERLIMLATESSLTTHASPQCLSACQYFCIVLAGLMAGEEREVVLADNWPPMVTLRTVAPLHPEIDRVARGSFKDREEYEITGSGYVVASLEAALWAFHDARDFSDAVLKAVNLGDDADTTGAVCGQLAGAYWGASGLPMVWLDGLARRELIETAVDRLVVE